MPDESANLGGMFVRVKQGPSGSYILMVQESFEPTGAHVSQSLSGAYAPSTPADATKCLVQAITQNARFTMDGSTPSSSTGFRITAGDPPMVIPASDSVVLKFIEETTGAVLQLQWGY
jgi:hypothetical protein